MPPTAFLFDCFGVVCDPVLGGWFKKNRLDKGLPDEKLSDVFRRFDLGLMTEDDVADYFRSYEGVRLSREEMWKELDSFHRVHMSMVSIIRQLRAQGFKTSLLSNANNSFFERKVYPGFLEFKALFDEIIISSVVGMVKPDADIYRYALGKIGAKPEETLFIDDAKHNVDAAMALGLQGYVFTDSAAFAAHLLGLGIQVTPRPQS